MTEFEDALRSRGGGGGDDRQATAAAADGEAATAGAAAGGASLLGTRTRSRGSSFAALMGRRGSAASHSSAASRGSGAAAAGAGAAGAGERVTPSSSVRSSLRAAEQSQRGLEEQVRELTAQRAAALRELQDVREERDDAVQAGQALVAENEAMRVAHGERGLLARHELDARLDEQEGALRRQASQAAVATTAAHQAALRGRDRRVARLEATVVLAMEDVRRRGLLWRWVAHVRALYGVANAPFAAARALKAPAASAAASAELTGIACAATPSGRLVEAASGAVLPFAVSADRSTVVEFGSLQRPVRCWVGAEAATVAVVGSRLTARAAAATAEAGPLLVPAFLFTPQRSAEAGAAASRLVLARAGVDEMIPCRTPTEPSRSDAAAVADGRRPPAPPAYFTTPAATFRSAEATRAFLRSAGVAVEGGPLVRPRFPLLLSDAGQHGGAEGGDSVSYRFCYYTEDGDRCLPDGSLLFCTPAAPAAAATTAVEDSSKKGAAAGSDKKGWLPVLSFDHSCVVRRPAADEEQGDVAAVAEFALDDGRPVVTARGEPFVWASNRTACTVGSDGVTVLGPDGLLLVCTRDGMPVRVQTTAPRRRRVHHVAVDSHGVSVDLAEYDAPPPPSLAQPSSIATSVARLPEAEAQYRSRAGLPVSFETRRLRWELSDGTPVVCGGAEGAPLVWEGTGCVVVTGDDEERVLCPNGRDVLVCRSEGGAHGPRPVLISDSGLPVDDLGRPVVIDVAAETAALVAPEGVSSSAAPAAGAAAHRPPSFVGPSPQAEQELPPHLQFVRAMITTLRAAAPETSADGAAAAAAAAPPPPPPAGGYYRIAVMKEEEGEAAATDEPMFHTMAVRADEASLRSGQLSLFEAFRAPAHARVTLRLEECSDEGAVAASHAAAAPVDLAAVAAAGAGGGEVALSVQLGPRFYATLLVRRDAEASADYAVLRRLGLEVGVGGRGAVCLSLPSPEDEGADALPLVAGGGRGGRRRGAVVFDEAMRAFDVEEAAEGEEEEAVPSPSMHAVLQRYGLAIAGDGVLRVAGATEGGAARVVVRYDADAGGFYEGEAEGGADAGAVAALQAELREAKEEAQREGTAARVLQRYGLALSEDGTLRTAAGLAAEAAAATAAEEEGAAAAASPAAAPCVVRYDAESGDFYEAEVEAAAADPRVVEGLREELRQAVHERTLAEEAAAAARSKQKGGVREALLRHGLEVTDAGVLRAAAAPASGGGCAVVLKYDADAAAFYEETVEEVPAAADPREVAELKAELQATSEQLQRALHPDTPPLLPQVAASAAGDADAGAGDAAAALLGYGLRVDAATGLVACEGAAVPALAYDGGAGLLRAAAPPRPSSAAGGVARSLHAALAAGDDEAAHAAVAAVASAEQWEEVQDEFCDRFRGTCGGDVVAAMRGGLGGDAFARAGRLLAAGGVALEGAREADAGRVHAVLQAMAAAEGGGGGGGEAAAAIAGAVRAVLSAALPETAPLASLEQAFAARYPEFHGGDFVGAAADALRQQQQPDADATAERLLVSLYAPAAVAAQAVVPALQGVASQGRWDAVAAAFEARFPGCHGGDAAGAMRAELARGELARWQDALGPDVTLRFPPPPPAGGAASGPAAPAAAAAAGGEGAAQFWAELESRGLKVQKGGGCAVRVGSGGQRPASSWAAVAGLAWREERRCFEQASAAAAPASSSRRANHNLFHAALQPPPPPPPAPPGAPSTAPAASAAPATPATPAAPDYYFADPAQQQAAAAAAAAAAAPAGDANATPEGRRRAEARRFEEQLPGVGLLLEEGGGGRAAVRLRGSGGAAEKAAAGPVVMLWNRDACAFEALQQPAAAVDQSTGRAAARRNGLRLERASDEDDRLFRVLRRSGGGDGRGGQQVAAAGGRPAQDTFAPLVTHAGQVVFFDAGTDGFFAGATARQERAEVVLPAGGGGGGGGGGGVLVFLSVAVDARRRPTRFYRGDGGGARCVRSGDEVCFGSDGLPVEAEDGFVVRRRNRFGGAGGGGASRFPFRYVVWTQEDEAGGGCGGEDAAAAAEGDDDVGGVARLEALHRETWVLPDLPATRMGGPAKAWREAFCSYFGSAVGGGGGGGSSSSSSSSGPPVVDPAAVAPLVSAATGRAVAATPYHAAAGDAVLLAKRLDAWFAGGGAGEADPQPCVYVTMQGGGGGGGGELVATPCLGVCRGGADCVGRDGVCVRCTGRGGGGGGLPAPLRVACWRGGRATTAAAPAAATATEPVPRYLVEQRQTQAAAAEEDADASVASFRLLESCADGDSVPAAANVALLRCGGDDDDTCLTFARPAASPSLLLSLGGGTAAAAAGSGVRPTQRAAPAAPALKRCCVSGTVYSACGTAPAYLVQTDLLAPQWALPGAAAAAAAASAEGGAGGHAMWGWRVRNPLAALNRFVEDASSSASDRPVRVGPCRTSDGRVVTYARGGGGGGADAEPSTAPATPDFSITATGPQARTRPLPVNPFTEGRTPIFLPPTATTGAAAAAAAPAVVVASAAPPDGCVTAGGGAACVVAGGARVVATWEAAAAAAAAASGRRPEEGEGATPLYPTAEDASPHLYTLAYPLYVLRDRAGAGRVGGSGGGGGFPAVDLCFGVSTVAGGCFAVAAARKAPGRHALATREGHRVLALGSVVGQEAAGRGNGGSSGAADKTPLRPACPPAGEEADCVVVAAPLSSLGIAAASPRAAASSPSPSPSSALPPRGDGFFVFNVAAHAARPALAAVRTPAGDAPYLWRSGRVAHTAADGATVLSAAGAVLVSPQGAPVRYAVEGNLVHSAGGGASGHALLAEVPGEVDVRPMLGSLQTAGVLTAYELSLIRGRLEGGSGGDGGAETLDSQAAEVRELEARVTAEVEFLQRSLEASKAEVAEALKRAEEGRGSAAGMLFCVEAAEGEERTELLYAEVFYREHTLFTFLLHHQTPHINPSSTKKNRERCFSHSSVRASRHPPSPHRTTCTRRTRARHPTAARRASSLPARPPRSPRPPHRRPPGAPAAQQTRPPSPSCCGVRSRTGRTRRARRPPPRSVRTPRRRRTASSAASGRRSRRPGRSANTSPAPLPRTPPPRCRRRRLWAAAARRCRRPAAECARRDA